MSTLILIPARAGSKGLPGKNIKLLGGKPLISYTFEFSKKIQGDGDVICLSTNDDDIVKIAVKGNIKVHFKRPEELASDTAGTYDVIMHALKYYQGAGYKFNNVLLLQPTSPFRNLEDYKELVDKFDTECDMAVTVKFSKENPYFNLFEEDADGYLKKCSSGNFVTRQDCPPVYSLNGSMYLMKVSSLLKGNLASFKKITKVLMPEERSIDIDNYTDWLLAEYFLKKNTNENS